MKVQLANALMNLFQLKLFILFKNLKTHVYTDNKKYD